MVVYRPPKLQPVIMDDKCSTDTSRREKALPHMATENPYLKEIIDAAADRPEEWKETVGDESKEFVNYMQQREKQEKEIIDAAADRPEEWKETVGDESKEFVNYMQQREKQEKAGEELFAQAPVTKREKHMEKQMRKQLHGYKACARGWRHAAVPVDEGPCSSIL